MTSIYAEQKHEEIIDDKFYDEFIRNTIGKKIKDDFKNIQATWDDDTWEKYYDIKELEAQYF